MGQAHTTSYYAATINDETRYAALEGDEQVDVCVVGGGFTGIGTALTLAERGYKVCVLEANRIGWGASGRNGGQLIGGISGESQLLKTHGQEIGDLLWDMCWAGHEIIRNRVNMYGIQCDLKAGYLDVAIKKRHVQAIEEEQKELEARNFPFETRVLSRDETCELIGTDEYIGAHLNMCNGHLHPLNLVLGEARAAAAHGASIHENSAVTNIENGKMVRVNTENGSVQAKFAVLAGNAYQTFQKTLRSRLLPVRSYIMATQPLAAEQVAEINPQDLAVCDPNFVLEYFRLSADKRLLFGGRIPGCHTDPGEIEKRLRPKMERVYPRLSGIKADFAWGGTIAVPVNRVPQLGRLADNVYYSNAYSGHGVNVTHLAGTIIADVIAGTAERFDLFAKIPSMRIPGVTVFGKTMVSLGMTYYAIKDKL